MRTKQVLYQMTGIPSDLYILVCSNTTLKDSTIRNMLLTMPVASELLMGMNAQGFTCCSL